MEKDQYPEGKRSELLNEMAEISVMRRGTVNEQFFDKKRKDGSVKGMGLITSTVEPKKESLLANGY